MGGGGILYFHGSLIAMVNQQSAESDMDMNLRITDTLPGRLVATEFAGCLVAVSFIVSN